MTPPYYINTHTHCFTLAHVPEGFFDELIGGKRFLAISKLRRSSFNSFLVKLFTKRFMIWLVGLFSTELQKNLLRLKGLLKYRTINKQEVILQHLRDYYKAWKQGVDFKFVPLLMDMEYMGAGKPAEDYTIQLNQMKTLKADKKWKDVLYPFVFADPRRPGVFDIVKNHLEDQSAPFTGIKIYPALGYFPFDKGLKEIYLYAVEKNIPIVSHCIDGSVYFRTKPIPGQKHPISGHNMYGSNAYSYQLNWTHPLNFECLLNQKYLKQYWGDDAPDFSKLKICLAHFGGENEWKTDRLLKNFFLKKSIHGIAGTDYLDISRPWFGSNRYKWLLIIIELLRKHKNLYADISFTLHDESIYPRLKELLADSTINKRILFGTDYYVVASVTDEDDLLSLFRKNLNDENLFDLIAYQNPKCFLGL